MSTMKNTIIGKENWGGKLGSDLKPFQIKRPLLNKGVLSAKSKNNLNRYAKIDKQGFEHKYHILKTSLKNKSGWKFGKHNKSVEKKETKENSLTVEEKEKEKEKEKGTNEWIGSNKTSFASQNVNKSYHLRDKGKTNSSPNPMTMSVTNKTKSKNVSNSIVVKEEVTTPQNRSKISNPNLSKNSITNLSKNSSTNWSKNSSTNLSKNPSTNWSKNSITNLSKNSIANWSKNSSTNWSKNSSTNLKTDSANATKSKNVKTTYTLNKRNERNENFKNNENDINNIKQKKKELVQRAKDLKQTHKENLDELLKEDNKIIRRINTKNLMDFKTEFETNAPSLFCENAYNIKELPRIEEKLDVINSILENQKQKIKELLNSCIENDKKCHEILEVVLKALIDGDDCVLAKINKNKNLEEEIVTELERMINDINSIQM